VKRKVIRRRPEQGTNRLGGWRLDLAALDLQRGVET
jgi:hypothetical protein